MRIVLVMVLMLMLSLPAYSAPWGKKDARTQEVSKALDSTHGTDLSPIVIDKNPADMNPAPSQPQDVPMQDYTVGIDDILDISVLQPEQISNEVIVSPDGSISFPYIGNVNVKGMTINDIQNDVQKRLSDGYLKYPSVVVSLKESRSRKFFVYGAVNKPGPYPMEYNDTVLKAISMAGGFTRFGSASRVKLLRPKEQGGYKSIPINIKAVMDGDSQADLSIKSGDIVVVSEGLI